MNKGKQIQKNAYYFGHRSCELEGRLVGGQMLVSAGSSARADARPGAPESILKRRRDLVVEGNADVIGGRFVLIKDHIFTTPGLAVDLMNGGHVREPLKLWRALNGSSLLDAGEHAHSD